MISSPKRAKKKPHKAASFFQRVEKIFGTLADCQKSSKDEQLTLVGV